MGCRGGGKNHLQPILADQLHDFVQLGKVIYFLFRLQRGPGEDIQRHGVDICQLEQPHILFPYRFLPLLGIVIASIRNFVVVPDFFIHRYILPVKESEIVAAGSMQSISVVRLLGIRVLSLAENIPFER